MILTQTIQYQNKPLMTRAAPARAPIFSPGVKGAGSGLGLGAGAERM